jgi:large subunit ribosomal protein L22
MKTIARLRHLGVSSVKARRYASTIKGEPVERAVAILELQPSPTCQALGKLLKSAVANAQENGGLAAEHLYVSNVLVDQGPSLKRIKPRARGRAYRILKRSCHLTVEVDLKPGITPEGLAEEQVPPKRVPRKKKEPAKTKTAGKAESKAEQAEKKPPAKAKAGAKSSAPKKRRVSRAAKAVDKDAEKTAEGKPAEPSRTSRGKARKKDDEGEKE